MSLKEQKKAFEKSRGLNFHPKTTRFFYHVYDILIKELEDLRDDNEPENYFWTN